VNSPNSASVGRGYLAKVRSASHRFPKLPKAAQLAAAESIEGRIVYVRHESRCRCTLVFRDLSGSIALQRSVSTVCLAVLVRCGAQNARQNKRLRGSEMIEWE
jgi:hypothetical protein